MDVHPYKLIIRGEFVIEEYATEGILQKLEIELDNIAHIEPEDWKLLKGIYKDRSCKELIIAMQSLEIYRNNIQQISQELDKLRNISGVVVGVQELEKTLKEVSDKIQLTSNAEMICKLAKDAVPLQEKAKTAVPLQEKAKIAVPLQEKAKTAAPLQEKAETTASLQEISKNLVPISEKKKS